MTFVSHHYHLVSTWSDRASSLKLLQTGKKKFDFSIGLGTDYDKTLLDHLGKTFQKDQSNNMLNFLNQYFSDNKNYVIIEPNHFLVSQNEFLVAEVTENQEMNDAKITSVSKGVLQEMFQFVQKMHPVHI